MLERTAVGWRRTGLRLGVYFGLLIAFLVAGQYAASFLPRHPLGWVSYLMITAGALAAGWVALSRVDGRPPGALGFTLGAEAPREIGSGLLVGAALIAATVGLLLVTGAAAFAPDEGTVAGYLAHLAVALAFFGLAAAAEELLFRGYAFQALVDGIGVWPAVLLSSAVFSWMHGQNPNIDAIGFGNIFLAGVLLAVAYLRTRSLWFATAVHAGWNWTMAALLDFPVSGLTGFDTPLYEGAETGRDWWTGGAFGPEAGLAGTLVLLAGTLWLLRTRRLDESPRMRELAPLVDRRLDPMESRRDHG